MQFLWPVGTMLVNENFPVRRGEPVEVWRPIPGYEGSYEVSSEGRIRTIDRTFITVSGAKQRKRSRLMELMPARGGYLRVCLYRDGVGQGAQVHRLVAAAFLSNPEGKPHVNHVNFVKTDNRLVNLEWVTQSENQQHSARHGRFNPILNPKRALKYSAETIAEFRERVRNGERAGTIRREYGISSAHADRIAKGTTWRSPSEDFSGEPQDAVRQYRG